MSAKEQQLSEIFRQLDAGAQEMLLTFADFLVSRSPAQKAPRMREPVVIPEPEQIERPAGETVIAGLKRLSRTYPMLDKSVMLSATSDLVAQHIMQGTDTAAVIDELETIFEKQYRLMKEDAGS